MNSWRYVIAISGNYVFLWDTERGIELSKQPHSFRFSKGDEPILAFGEVNGDKYIVIKEDADDDEQKVFKVSVAK